MIWSLSIHKQSKMNRRQKSHDFQEAKNKERRKKQEKKIMSAKSKALFLLLPIVAKRQPEDRSKALWGRGKGRWSCTPPMYHQKTKN